MATVPETMSLAQSLSRLRQHLRWPEPLPLLAPPDGVGDDGGGRWEPAEAVATDTATITGLIEANVTLLEAKQQSTAATLAWKDYCQAVTLLPVASWFVDQRVPEVSTSNLSLRISDTPPLAFPALRMLKGYQIAGTPLGGTDFEVPDGAAVHRDDATQASIVTVADDVALADRLGQVTWHDHLAHMAEAFAAAVAVDPIIFRGLAASVAVAALPRVASLADQGQDIFEAAETLIRVFDAENLVEIASLTPPNGAEEPMALRLVCCQAYRVPPAKNCSTCPLLTDDGRNEVLVPYGYSWRRR